MISSSSRSNSLQLIDWETLEAPSNFLEDFRIKELVKGFLSTSLSVKFPLKEEALNPCIARYHVVLKYQSMWKFYSLTALTHLASEIREKKKNPLIEYLSIGVLALYKRFHLKLYDTQIITLLALLLHPIERTKILAQVKTGEGKTVIIATLAFVLSMKGKSVHIISSSQALAKRDEKEYRSFFNCFGRTTSHLCSISPPVKDFNAHILYGTASDFEFALMREMAYGDKLFAASPLERPFECVIVDEVDNLMIDTFLNSSRIAFPSLHPKRCDYEKIFSLAQEERLKGNTLVNSSMMSQLKSKLLESSNSDCKKWLTSAFLALELEEDVDYIIQKNKDGQLSIKIIDQSNTGRICHGMRWQAGLHEFLEVKHQIKPEKETITPLTHSHVTLYDRYHTIMGLSGTLGSETERSMLKTIYKVESFDVPHHLPSKRVDYPFCIFNENHLYVQSILSSVKKKVRAGRPILIIADSIKKTKLFAQLFFEHNLKCQMFNETQECAPTTVIKRGGFSQSITIATNNAGRGLHLPLTKESKEKGGLHVIFTFYPSSQRVEDQGLGRAGRQGNKGSTEIFVYSKSLGKEKLQMAREQQEQLRAATLVERAKAERCLFDYSTKFWATLNKWKKKALSPGKKVEGNFFEYENGVSQTVSEVIYLWTKFFYKPAEELIVNSDFNKGTVDLEKLFQESQNEWGALLK